MKVEEGTTEEWCVVDQTGSYAPYTLGGKWYFDTDSHIMLGPFKSVKDCAAQIKWMRLVR